MVAAHMLLSASAWALPAVGDVVSGMLDLSVSRKIPLPPGSYQVVASFEEKVNVSGSSTGASDRTEPIHVLTLVNTDPQADVPVIAMDFSLHAKVNWHGQPCDNKPQGVLLNVQSFGTTAGSVLVKCERVFSQLNLRNFIRNSESSKENWVRTRLGPLASLAALNAQLPNNGVALTGYLSKAGADRINFWFTMNPALFGLDEGDGKPSLFRNLDGTDPRIGNAKAFVKGTVEWGEAYMDLLEKGFVAGRGAGELAVKPPAFAGLQRQDLQAQPAGMLAKAPVPVPAAAPTSTSTSAPPQPSKTLAKAAEPTVAALQVERTGAPAGATSAATTAALALPAPQAAKPSALPTALAAVPPQRVHALVIGNSAYGAAKLANPRNDAMAMAERFRRFGFEVTLVLDADRRQLVKSLAQFSNTARNAEVGIVFYAGHGIQVGGINYLVPVDLDLSGDRSVSISLEAVSVDSILQEHLPGKSKLVFLDACRDNPLARSIASSRGGGAGLAPVQAGSGILISYATRDGGTAADGSGKNSPYTTALLAHLDANEDIALVLRKVRQQVLANTSGRQEPWEYGSLIGDALVLSRVAAKP